MREWSKQRQAAGKPTLAAYVVLLTILVLAALWIFAAARPHTTRAQVNFTVYTDASVGTDIPEECLRFAGYPVTIEDADTGEVLWRGETEVLSANIRIPALGCTVAAYAGEIIEVPWYRVTIEGMGEHVYSLETLEDRYHFLEWDDVCLQDQNPCDVQQVFYDS